MSSSPETTYTIQQFINSGSGSILSYDSLSYIGTMSNGTEAPFHNVINDYIDELVACCATIELNDDEFRKYVYKPKLLCQDIYGNPELYFVILRVNNMADVKQFNRRKVKMLPKNSMTSLMTSIYNAEKKMIDDYNL